MLRWMGGPFRFSIFCFTFYGTLANLGGERPVADLLLPRSSTFRKRHLMDVLTRRTALQSLGIAALGMGLLPRLARADDEEIATVKSLSDWAGQLEQNAQRLRQRQSSPLEWQEVMDQLYANVPFDALKEHLSFESLSKTLQEQMPADRHELFHTLHLPDPQQSVSDVRPEPKRVLITKLAHVRKGHAIPPHGHSSMVSAFLCLSGEFDVQLYDRLEQRDKHLVVRRTLRDQHAGPGTWSSVSEYRDNVHWLTAQTDDCFLFTCKMLSVEPDIPLNGRINLDMRRPKKLGTDTFLAQKISSQEAREIY